MDGADIVAANRKRGKCDLNKKLDLLGIAYIPQYAHDYNDIWLFPCKRK